MRLNQYIASCGICSRREADKLISSNRVYVDGQLASCGMQVDDSSQVTVDGKAINLVSENIVLAYYKPVGVVCTENDAHAEKTVKNEIKFDKRVTYCGRLDKDSEGLLLLTNDGNLINAIMKGSAKHEKEYEVVVDKEVTGDFLNKMSSGIYLKDLDKTTRPCKVKKTGKYSFNIILTQGLNRQIRRMCSSLSYEVKKLKRIRVMNVELKNYNLNPGKYKPLDEKDLKKLYSLSGLK